MNYLNGMVLKKVNTMLGIKARRGVLQKEDFLDGLRVSTS
jgi:hypothetical protein